MRYIILIIAVIALAGCDMNRNNTMHFKFSMAENIQADDNLHINFIFYSNHSASDWYSYQKRITIVHDGELLINKLNEKNVLYSNIKIANPNRSLYHASGSDNVYGNIGVDVFETYQFDSTSYELSVQVDDDPKTTNSLRKYKKLNEPLSLGYYDPTISKYQIYPLDDDTLEYIAGVYTFEELAASDKLLKEDIERLTHLTADQIQALISIHSKKDFRKIDYAQ